MRFRSPRSRPTSEAAGKQDPATVPGPADPTDPAVTATAARPSPTTRRPRPRPLPIPRPEAGNEEVAAEPSHDVEDDEYWDDEFEDDYFDDEDSDEEYDDDDEYWDDEYEDDYLDDDEYDDDVEDEYDDLGDEEGEPGAVADADAERRRRRLLRRRRAEGGRRRGRLGRRGRPRADELAPEPADLDAPESDDQLLGDDQLGDEDADARVPAPRRRVPRVPIAAMRARTASAWADTRDGFRYGWADTRSQVGRGWAATRRGVAAAVHFLRTHWGRAAYVYLAFVGAGLLMTVLLYWHSGFTYDECTYCGMPVLMTVSPWWLIILPFNVSSWPLLLPLFVLLLFAVLNAELFDRWSKRPQSEYPDWE